MARLSLADRDGNGGVGSPRSASFDGGGGAAGRGDKHLAANTLAFGVFQGVLVRRLPSLARVFRPGAASTGGVGGSGGSGGLGGPGEYGVFEGLSQGEIAGHLIEVAKAAAHDCMRPAAPARAAVDSAGGATWDWATEAQAEAYAAEAEMAAAAAAAAEQAEAEQCLGLLLDVTLTVYSRHPLNYGLIEPRFRLLSLFVAASVAFASVELKEMVRRPLRVFVQVELCTKIIPYIYVNTNQRYCGHSST